MLQSAPLSEELQGSIKIIQIASEVSAEVITEALEKNTALKELVKRGGSVTDSAAMIKSALNKGIKSAL